MQLKLLKSKTKCLKTHLKLLKYPKTPLKLQKSKNKKLRIIKTLLIPVLQSLDPVVRDAGTGPNATAKTPPIEAISPILETQILRVTQKTTDLLVHTVLPATEKIKIIEETTNIHRNSPPVNVRIHAVIYVLTVTKKMVMSLNK